MKLSREALSQIFNTLRDVYKKKEGVEPSATWQNRLMDDIRQQPKPTRRSFRPALWVALFLLLLIALFCLYFLGGTGAH
jgi:hypothetical protein